MTRVLSGAVLIILAVAAVWWAPPTLFLGIAVLLAAMASHELMTLAGAAALDASSILAIISTTLALAVVTEPGWTVLLPVVLMATVIATAFVTMGAWRSGPGALAAVSASLLPSIYIGLPVATLVNIRESRGAAVLFLLMLTVIISDTAQYYTGRTFGRTPLAPVISPKKTMEGATGGFVFGALTMVVAGNWWLPGVPAGMRAALGIAIVALGIGGDLFESMLKRSAGVKDSSALIPGHGGILDRIDALLFAAPVYYIVLNYL